MTWAALGHELRAQDAMKSSGLWYLNDIGSGDQCTRCYQQLKVVVYMNDFGS